MGISSETEGLEEQLKALPNLGHRVLTAGDGAMFMFDLVVVGAVKRSLSLGHGLIAMLRSRNMTCARALLRMQLDTVSRLMAYTYVDDPEQLAHHVIGGKALNKFKCSEGKPLRDAYLIDRLTESRPWVREVYNRTSGEIHFSEKQFFSSVHQLDDAERTVTMCISPFDDKYPESSWSEVVSCFRELNEMLIEVLQGYALQKNG